MAGMARTAWTFGGTQGAARWRPNWSVPARAAAHPDPADRPAILPTGAQVRAGFGAFGAALTRTFGVVRGEVLRRHALAFQPGPAGIRGPALSRLLGELATPFESWRLPAQGAASPVVRPRPVMLIPGFATHSGRMRPLSRALAAAGHRVRDWGLGFNLGASEDRLDALCARVCAMARSEGEPVVLVGWSLGGLYAREVAHRCPDAVAMVVTMGTPFSGDRRANNAWRVYQLVAGHTVDEPPMPCRFAEKPPVPTIALWSPRDGVIAPRSAAGRPGERDAALAVRCTHVGFAGHPAVCAALNRLLAAA